MLRAVKKIIKLSICVLLVLALLLALLFGVLLIEDAVVNKGVMVYSDNRLNTTIDAHREVNSTTKFLQLAEEENLYYINQRWLYQGGETM